MGNYKQLVNNYIYICNLPHLPAIYIQKLKNALIKQRNLGFLLTFRWFSHEIVLSLWRESKLMDAMLIGREKENKYYRMLSTKSTLSLLQCMEDVVLARLS